MVVTGSWVHHSFDAGMVIDANSVSFSLSMISSNRKKV